MVYFSVSMVSMLMGLFGLLSLFVCFGSGNLMFFFFGLELNVYLALLLIYYKSYVDMFSISLVYYFVISVLASLLVFWGYLFSSYLVFSIGFMFKLGFFPFVWWFPVMVSSLDYFSFFYLKFVQKFLPFILVVDKNLFLKDLVYLVVLITYVFSIVGLYYGQFSVKIFLAWSSACKLCLFFFLGFFKWWFGVVFFFVYKLFFCLLLVCLSLESVCHYWDELFFGGSFFSFCIFFSLFVFMGFPPFLGFFFKTLVFFSLSTLSMVYFSVYMFFFFVLLMFLKVIMYLVVVMKFIFLDKVVFKILFWNSWIYLYVLLFFNLVFVF